MEVSLHRAWFVFSVACTSRKPKGTEMLMVGFDYLYWVLALGLVTLTTEKEVIRVTYVGGRKINKDWGS